ncbi:MAG: hypothetical protein IPK18_01400 [Sphingobacteriales bacterium]|nr:MAG: hypothetical protein IPK18_01400 [Sphingobacteriales bacterium]
MQYNSDSGLLVKNQQRRGIHYNTIIEAVRNAFNNGLLWYFDSTGTQLIPTNK